jgi:hypothetical protein
MINNLCSMTPLSLEIPTSSAPDAEIPDKSVQICTDLCVITETVNSPHLPHTRPTATTLCTLQHRPPSPCGLVSARRPEPSGEITEWNRGNTGRQGLDRLWTGSEVFSLSLNGEGPYSILSVRRLQ